jgi:hypothetical protein
MKTGLCQGINRDLMHLGVFQDAAVSDLSDNLTRSTPVVCEKDWFFRLLYNRARILLIEFMPDEWLGQTANKRHYPLPVVRFFLCLAPPFGWGIFFSMTRARNAPGFGAHTARLESVQSNTISAARSH